MCCALVSKWGLEGYGVDQRCGVAEVKGVTELLGSTELGGVAELGGDLELGGDPELGWIVTDGGNPGVYHHRKRPKHFRNK